ISVGFIGGNFLFEAYSGSGKCKLHFAFAWCTYCKLASDGTTRSASPRSAVGQRRAFCSCRRVCFGFFSPQVHKPINLVGAVPQHPIRDAFWIFLLEFFGSHRRHNWPRSSRCELGYLLEPALQPILL